MSLTFENADSAPACLNPNLWGINIATPLAPARCLISRFLVFWEAIQHNIYKIQVAWSSVCSWIWIITILLSSQQRTIILTSFYHIISGMLRIFDLYLSNHFYSVYFSGSVYMRHFSNCRFNLVVSFSYIYLSCLFFFRNYDVVILLFLI